ncbi:hypothetical protein EVAR_44814_1 [Eumeta japonica]|uniref:Uncharacterized protein n=1 Tax=Eumeta variegata TaxID=151549 RepID=A0A4C1X732_EUMVA|nr:hypothetical protein EVAR_44814_1 [Eumeta japonica]
MATIARGAGNRNGWKSVSGGEGMRVLKIRGLFRLISRAHNNTWSGVAAAVTARQRRRPPRPPPELTPSMRGGDAAVFVDHGDNLLIHCALLNDSNAVF